MLMTCWIDIYIYRSNMINTQLETHSLALVQLSHSMKHNPETRTQTKKRNAFHIREQSYLLITIQNQVPCMICKAGTLIRSYRSQQPFCFHTCQCIWILSFHIYRNNFKHKKNQKYKRTSDPYNTIIL